MALFVLVFWRARTFIGPCLDLLGPHRLTLDSRRPLSTPSLASNPPPSSDHLDLHDIVLTPHKHTYIIQQLFRFALDRPGDDQTIDSLGLRFSPTLTMLGECQTARRSSMSDRRASRLLTFSRKQTPLGLTFQSSSFQTHHEFLPQTRTTTPRSTCVFIDILRYVAVPH